MITIQADDFELAREYGWLREQAGDAGAIVTFTGLVREIYEPGQEGEVGAEPVSGLFLEHYAGMTERSLQQIVDEACRRWHLLSWRVIHRVGQLAPGDQIVLVGTASAHRQDAFDAACFIMDYLKSRAPFWKKQQAGTRSEWVESRAADEDALVRWRQGNES